MTEMSKWLESQNYWIEWGVAIAMALLVMLFTATAVLLEGERMSPLENSAYAIYKDEGGTKKWDELSEKEQDLLMGRAIDEDNKRAREE